MLSSLVSLPAGVLVALALLVVAPPAGADPLPDPAQDTGLGLDSDLAEVDTDAVAISDLESVDVAQGIPGRVLLTFDDLPEGPVGSPCPGVRFTDDWIVWDSSSHPDYPPHSGNNVIYSHKYGNAIIWEPAISDLSFYVSCVTSYADTYIYTAYDERGAPLEESSTLGGQNLLIEFSVEDIWALRVSGTGRWVTHNTLDDLAFSRP
jgi:hypothetical protein